MYIYVCAGFDLTFYLFEMMWKLSFHKLMMGEWRWKHIAKQIFLAQTTIFAVTENKIIVWEQIYCQINCIYFFEYSKMKCKICSKVTIKAPSIVLLSLLLIFSRFYTSSVFFADFECKWQMEYFIALRPFIINSSSKWQ